MIKANLWKALMTLKDIYVETSMERLNKFNTIKSIFFYLFL